MAVGPPRRRRTRADRIREARGRRRRRLASGLALGILVVVVIGVVFLGIENVAQRVRHGQRLHRQRRQRRGNPGPRRRFHDRDRSDPSGSERGGRPPPRSSTPRREMPRSRRSSPASTRCEPKSRPSNAVERLADPQNRVGKLVIPEGRQLDDVRDVKTNAVTDGILSLISKATCVDLDGERNCIAADALKSSASTADPSALAVPEWAVGPVNCDGHRPPPTGGAHRPGLVEHRSVRAATGHSVDADRRQRNPVRAGGLLDTAEGDEHVAVSDPDRRLAGAARSHTGGLRQGCAGHLQPAGRESHAGVRFHGELPARQDRSGDHGRRSRAADAVEHLCAARTSGDAHLFARAAGTRGG